MIDARGILSEIALIWLSQWTVIDVSVPRNDYGMFIIFDFIVMLLAFNISPEKTEFTLSLFSQKYNFV